MPDDSPDVIAFMAAFHRLRERVSDDPTKLQRLNRIDPTLMKLCLELSRADSTIALAERQQRQLYSAPTNPRFLTAWRDYQARYARLVAGIHLSELGLNVGQLAASTADDGNDFEQRWESENEEATSKAEALRVAVKLAEVKIEEQAERAEIRESDRDRLMKGIYAWRELVWDAEFDLVGVFRRRMLAPFVLIPRHVSDHYGSSDPLSLMARLQQAQEAFVYGVPIGALAIMRSILEIILRKHYQLGDGKLVKLVETAAANGLFLIEIRLSQIQMLLKLGNDAVHPNPEKLDKVPDVEKEVLSLLFILRTLIERTPNNAS